MGSAVPAEPETLLTQRKAELTDVDTVLAAIGQYAKLKNGLFIKRHPITEAEFLDARGGGAGQGRPARLSGSS